MFGAGFVSFALLAVVPTVVRGHAGITSPPIRSPGNAFLSACGQTSFDSVSNDPTGHIEEQEPVTAGCQLDLCRGMLIGDQPAANVQQVQPGEAMAMSVECTIPHGGPANVTLLDTTAAGPGVPIGNALASFDDFCPTSGATPADQSNLQFNLPSAADVGNNCQKAGDCVVQLFWATPDGTQNYFYCVDVAMSGAGAASSSASNAAASNTGAANVGNANTVAANAAGATTAASNTGAAVNSGTGNAAAVNAETSNAEAANASTGEAATVNANSANAALVNERRSVARRAPGQWSRHHRRARKTL